MNRIISILMRRDNLSLNEATNLFEEVLTEVMADLSSIVKVVRENTDVPCAIGFGISTPEQAKKMAALSDGAIVGSAIIKLLAAHGKNAAEYVGAYVGEMKQALGRRIVRAAA